MIFPVEKFAIQKRITEAELRGLSNVELTSRFDYMTESMVAELVARVTGSAKETEAVEYTPVDVPVVTRRNALRMWLSEDIAEGVLIRRWWGGPAVQVDPVRLVARFRYSERFCPHIHVPKHRAHLEFLMDRKPMGGQ